jgi:electron transport complex protein RnfA
VLPFGLLEYIFLFPLCYLVFSAYTYLINRFIFTKPSGHENKDSIFTGSMLSGTALFIMLNIAGNLAEAAVISLGFVLGIVLAVVIVGEIRRRSAMEAVPRFLRGGPLVLIAMGLLSLIFSSTALMFYEVLGAF